MRRQSTIVLHLTMPTLGATCQVLHTLLCLPVVKHVCSFQPLAFHSSLAFSRPLVPSIKEPQLLLSLVNVTAH